MTLWFTNSDYYVLAYDALPPVSGIAFMLIQVRVGLRSLAQHGSNDNYMDRSKLPMSQDAYRKWSMPMSFNSEGATSIATPGLMTPPSRKMSLGAAGMGLMGMSRGMPELREYEAQMGLGKTSNGSEGGSSGEKAESYVEESDVEKV